MHAHESKSDSSDVQLLTIYTVPFTLDLDKSHIPSEIIFPIGGLLTFPLPSYKQSPYEADLKMTLYDPAQRAKKPAVHLVSV